MIAMHHDDSGMSERGDMFWIWNRRKGNILLEMIARILLRFDKKERFKPPGHSKGSTEMRVM